MNFLLPLLNLGGLAFGLGSLIQMGLKSAPKQTPADIFGLVSQVAQQVVGSVEQANGSMSGADKKALAVQSAATILSHLGVNVPSAMIDAAIESAVLVVNQFYHPSNTPAPAAAPAGGQAQS